MRRHRLQKNVQRKRVVQQIPKAAEKAGRRENGREGRVGYAMAHTCKLSVQALVKAPGTYLLPQRGLHGGQEVFKDPPRSSGTVGIRNLAKEMRKEREKVNKVKVVKGKEKPRASTM